MHPRALAVAALLAVPFLSSTACAATRLVVDQEYFPVLMAALNGARKSVDVISFSFAIDDGKGALNLKGKSLKVADRLIELSRGGKRVRVYVEGSRSTAVRNRITGEYLSKGGVEVNYGSTHAKGFLIDDRLVLFGSTNLTGQSMNRNNETNVLIDDPGVAAGFKRYFEHLSRGGAHGAAALKPPLYADGAYKPLLLSLIKKASKTLEFSIYYFNDREIEDALAAAHRRGVAVTGFVNQHPTFAQELVARNRETVARLRAKGVTQVFLSDGTAFTHSKYLIIDGSETALGTGNWNRSDFEQHPQLYIHLKEPVLSRQLADHLAQQIRTESAKN